MSAIVHYIKHWDNDTKGSISFTEINDLTRAIELTRLELTDDALENSEDDAVVSADPASLFTITKAYLVGDVQAYAGHVSSL